MTKLEAFIREHAGEALAAPFQNARTVLGDLPERMVSELAWVYGNRNGFYAFSGALHFYPLADIDSTQEVRRWNLPETWKSEFADLDGSIFCFAENLFGEQFCIVGEAVFRLDPETGEMEPMGNSLDEWCSSLLSDYEVQTGYPIATEWIESHGPLPAGSRLVPKIPFACGGEFDMSNLHLSIAVDSMRFRANIANQLRNVADGEQIKFTIGE